jgi:7-cyano-7-deazaguanine synthase
MGFPMTSSTLLLLSGGMDSIALAWGYRPDLTLTINYGQRSAAGEQRAASSVAAALGLRHRGLHIDCSALGSGDLAGTKPLEIAPEREWWPFRNQLLLSLAAPIALQEGLTTILIGSVRSDSFHADGKREFIDAMRMLLQIQEGGITVEAPALEEDAAELCRRVQVPYEVLAWSHSCHTSEYACGWCRGCNKHRSTMCELGYGEY